MGLFTRKKSSFSNTGVDLGPSRRPLYVRPSKEDLESLKQADRVSLYPHMAQSSSRAKHKKTTAKKRPSRAQLLRDDFIAFSPKGTDDFVGFAKKGYDSQSHLGRNLTFKI